MNNFRDVNSTHYTRVSEDWESVLFRDPPIERISEKDITSTSYVNGADTRSPFRSADASTELKVIPFRVAVVIVVVII